MRNRILIIGYPSHKSIIIYSCKPISKSFIPNSRRTLSVDSCNIESKWEKMGRTEIGKSSSKTVSCYTVLLNLYYKFGLLYWEWYLMMYYSTILDISPYASRNPRWTWQLLSQYLYFVFKKLISSYQFFQSHAKVPLNTRTKW